MPLNIVPQPRKVRPSNGFCPWRFTSVKHGDLPASGRPALKHKLAELGLRGQRVSDMPALTMVFGEQAEVTAPNQPEGYALRITPAGITVRGHDADGLYWGLVTVEQLAAGASGGRLPCVTIHDWPAFAVRYHHDDVSRKQISTVEDFKNIIRRLSSFKINHYTPYMEDVLFLPSHPDIGRGRGRLTAAEVRAVLAEAKLHNITVFPTYSLAGHQENLLSQPRYRKYAREVFQPPSSYDPTKPILKPFLRRVIADVCDLFPDAPYFHACFDEIQGLPAEQVIAHANWCAAQIASHGKRMLMWADMFKNHFGLKRLGELHPNIIPVEWNYGDPRQSAGQYRQAKITPWLLGGYGNWQKFLPDFADGKRNMDLWAVTARRGKLPAFGASQWGDDGYENHRDLAWNLFAYNAEVAWTGKPGTADFEKRFQTAFYGRPLPRLEQLISDIAPHRRIAARRTWQLFRYSIPAMARLAAAEPGIIEDARHDIKVLTRALRTLPGLKRMARRNQDHLDHFTVALEREINTRRRLLLADRVRRACKRDGITALPSPLRQSLDEAQADLRRIRNLYRAAWLRHNKRPNIEVSLAVYDRVIDSIKQVIAPAPTAASQTMRPLELDEYYNSIMPQVADLPLRRGRVNRVPFLFAPVSHTHIAVRQDQPLMVTFSPARVRDVHLVYGAQTIDRQTPRDAVEVALLRGGKEIFVERLKTITQLCDWWAPLGEHLWAGGGFQYVDQRRNAYALSPGHGHGLMHLRHFSIPDAMSADALRIRNLGEEHFNLFAVTLEHG